MFQFQTGAIRRIKWFASLTAWREFQFQTGAIRSTPGTLFTSFSIPFRFQTGAIRSKKSLPTALVDESFDSKLVRLEVCRLQVLLLITCVSIPNWCD